MTGTSFDQFINSSILKADTVLQKLLEESNNLSKAVLVVFCYPSNRIYYIGKDIERLSGYPTKKFLDQGGRMIMSVSLPEEIPAQMAVQAAYIQRCKSHNFDPRTDSFQVYDWTLVHCLGDRIPVQSSGVMLTYTSDYDPEYGVGFHIDKRNITQKEKAECVRLLHQIKERHNQIHIHPVHNGKVVPFFTNYLHKMMDSITVRERQLLVMIAGGYSSARMARELGIAFNTVETHRKKLLDKFEARNTAELIKKASTIFWLG